MFGLTRAEARVATQLTSGGELDEIAHTLGVSINAVKFHLKSIYAKTGTRHKGEVIALLLNCLAHAPAQGPGASDTSLPTDRPVRPSP